MTGAKLFSMLLYGHRLVTPVRRYLVETATMAVAPGSVISPSSCGIHAYRDVQTATGHLPEVCGIPVIAACEAEGETVIGEMGWVTQICHLTALYLRPADYPAHSRDLYERYRIPVRPLRSMQPTMQPVTQPYVPLTHPPAIRYVRASLDEYRIYVLRDRVLRGRYAERYSMWYRALQEANRHSRHIADYEWRCHQAARAAGRQRYLLGRYPALAALAGRHDIRDIIGIARSRGSSSQTRAGAWRYIRSHMGMAVTRVGVGCSVAKAATRGAAALRIWQRKQYARRADRIAAALGIAPRNPGQEWLRIPAIRSVITTAVGSLRGLPGGWSDVDVTDSGCGPRIVGSEYVARNWNNCGASGTVYHPSTRRLTVGCDWLARYLT